MPTEDELLAQRREKVDEVRRAGIEPYPYRFDRSHLINEVRGIDASSDDIAIAGRVVAVRGHGRIMFMDVEDSSGRIQVLIVRADLSSLSQLVAALIDVGDFVGVIGRVITTLRGETTVEAAALELLSKSTRSLPDKRHGIQDPELKYRRRSEYLVSNRADREIFVKRAAAVTAVRRFLDDRGFIEVETPVLQPVFGGATARPFTTHVNALDRDFYLSVSPELYLKRVLVAGFERIYAIGKNFRNEGIDRSHNPEFTMMECYQAYADYTDMMELTESLYACVMDEVNGTTQIEYPSETGTVLLDFSPPWRRASMIDLVREFAHVDVAPLNGVELAHVLTGDARFSEFIQMLEHRPIEVGWGRLVQALFEHFAEPNLIQPTFVIDHPRESTPLCKGHRLDPRLIERFEPFVCGMEIGNAYTELNDPVLQRALLAAQQSDNGNDRAQLDEEFCRAVEVGLPPTGGLGLGIDRLVMLVTGTRTIKDVILFPLVRD